MTSSDLTQEESALYDRQIRLWGLEAQQKIRNARVIMCGNLQLSMAAECLKNLTLAGFGSLTLVSNEKVDRSSLFLLASDKGQQVTKVLEQRIVEMNPRVKVNCIASLDQITDVSQYDLLCSFSMDFDQVKSINLKFPKMFTADQWGMYGYIRTSLGQHSYIVERKRPGPSPANEIITEKKSYSHQWPTLDSTNESVFDGLNLRKLKRVTSALNLAWWVIMRYKLEHNQYPELANKVKLLELKAVMTEQWQVGSDILSDEFLMQVIKDKKDMPVIGAIMGGLLAQDLIRAVSGKDCPIRNMLSYDGEHCLSDVSIVPYVKQE